MDEVCPQETKKMEEKNGGRNAWETGKPDPFGG